MGKRRPSIPAGQFAFSFDPPAPARAQGSLAGLGREIAATVAVMLKEDGRSRFELAGKVSELLDDDVTKGMLDAYASEARENHAISAERLLALVAVTDRHDLLDRLMRRIGATVLVGEQILTAELGHIDRQIAELKSRRRSIENAAPVIATNGKGSVKS
ncbi:MAG: hypothetical protein CVT77_06450 [Alphaproteobacteria bacterium HGW-Alphaproteobacteria-16]|nr:MAG: hypothetical protein CVT77_06450 [Alphaproteobacteria bacterium HGW-Alphaproteobacteria-16]